MDNLQVLDMEIMAELKHVREKRKLTQRQVALRIGIPERNISTWENEGSTPSLENFFLLLQVLGIQCFYTIRK